MNLSTIRNAPAIAGGAATAQSSIQAVTYSSPLSSQLEKIAKERTFDLTAVLNAFEPSVNWVQANAKPKVVENTQEAEKQLLASRVKSFLHTHRLMAVIHNQSGGAAIVNNRTVPVGKTLAGFKLIKVTSRGAVFEDQGQQIELNVATRTPLPLRDGAPE